MDADILRLILIVLGGFLVLGIYLWERHRRVDTRVQAIRRERQEERREPSLGAKEPANVPEERKAKGADPQAAAELDRSLQELGDLVAEEGKPIATKVKTRGGGKLRRDSLADTAVTEQQDLFAADAVVDSDHYRNADPSIPAMILQINVVASDPEGFEGPDIRRVVEGVGMHLGDMNIYHRGEGGAKGSVLFSMASMVEPGTFPRDAWEEFHTPGLTLFAQLPGPQDGVVLFSDMLFTAERIAAELDGELQDETHSRLTKQTIGHIRSQILEHRRRVQLARSRQSH